MPPCHEQVPRPELELYDPSLQVEPACAAVDPMPSKTKVPIVAAMLLFNI